MNGGCHAVGPRPLAPRHERFGVILYIDPELEFPARYLATYSQVWGSFISNLEGVAGMEFPVQYGADVILCDEDKAEPWVKYLHDKTIEARGAWDTHLEQYLPGTGEWYARVYEPLKEVVNGAMERHWNPTTPIEWEFANIANVD